MATISANELKLRGILTQRDGNHCIRLGVTGGAVTSDWLRAAAKIAEEFGTGQLHLTTRQTVEVPHVAPERLELLCARMTELGIGHASGGPSVRAVVACPGTDCCRFSQIASQALARAITEHTRSRAPLPHKFKIAVTACPNGCAKPVENDFGVMGLGPDKVRLYVGGRMGRKPRFADILDGEWPATPEAILPVLDAVLDWFCANAQGKERLGATIERVGLASLQKAVTGRA